MSPKIIRIVTRTTAILTIIVGIIHNLFTITIYRTAPAALG